MSGYVYNKRNTTYKALCVVFMHSLPMPLHQKSHSFVALTRSFHFGFNNSLPTYRTRTLSMKYSTCIMEKRIVTLRYHCSKISGSFLGRDGHLLCRMMEENYGLTFVPQRNRGQESHKCKLFRFFSAIFAEPRFVEIQKFCYHGNVT